MIKSDLSEKAWAMHCRGLASSEIARRLKVEPNFIREQIAARWRRDRERDEAEWRECNGR